MTISRLLLLLCSHMPAGESVIQIQPQMAVRLLSVHIQSWEELRAASKYGQRFLEQVTVNSWGKNCARQGDTEKGKIKS